MAMVFGWLKFELAGLKLTASSKPSGAVLRAGVKGGEPAWRAKSAAKLVVVGVTAM